MTAMYMQSYMNNDIIHIMQGRAKMKSSHMSKKDDIIFGIHFLHIIITIAVQVSPII